ncbi:MAG: hypothetical protein WBF84_00325 [Castellaniella sp.]|uniref:hypothetical protein n=1 Tax=Castellaniella sp. TaxID=1955812 RepID=UPI003C78DAD2
MSALPKEQGAGDVEFINANVAQPREESRVFNRIFPAALNFNPPDGAIVLNQYIGKFSPNAVLPAEPESLSYFSLSGYAIALHNGTDCDLIGNAPVPIVGATECSDQILAADGVDPTGLQSAHALRSKCVDPASIGGSAAQHSMLLSQATQSSLRHP